MSLLLRIVLSMGFVFLSTGCLSCVFRYIVVEGKCRGLDGSKRIWKSVRVVRTFRKLRRYSAVTDTRVYINEINRLEFSIEKGDLQLSSPPKLESNRELSIMGFEFGRSEILVKSSVETCSMVFNFFLGKKKRRSSTSHSSNSCR